MNFKIIFLFFVFLFSVELVFSQTNPYYNEVLDAQNTTTTKLIQKDPTNGIKVAQQFLTAAQKSKNPFYETQALSLIDAVYMNTNEYKKLLQSSEKTIVQAKQTNYFSKETEAFVRKSWALMHLGLLSDAKKTLDDSFIILDKLDESNDFNLEIIGNYWTCYQEYYNVQEMDKQAIEKGNNALSVLQKIKNNQLRNSKLIDVYSNIGSNYLFQKKTDSSAYYFKNAQKLIATTKEYDKKNEAIIASGLGMGYNFEKKHREAIPFLMKGLAISKQNKYHDIYVETLNQLSISFKESKDKSNPYLEQYLLEKKEFADKNKLKSKEIEEIKKDNTSFLDRNLYSIIATALLVVLLITIYFFSQRKKNKISEQEKSKISDIVKAQRSEISSLKKKMNDTFEELLVFAKTNNPGFLIRFTEMYPELNKKITQDYPELTATQMKILAFSYLNFSTKDIANFTKTSERTVETHKYKIRKIFQLETKESFINWVQKLGDEKTII